MFHLQYTVAPSRKKLNKYSFKYFEENYNTISTFGMIGIRVQLHTSFSYQHRNMIQNITGTFQRRSINIVSKTFPIAPDCIIAFLFIVQSIKERADFKIAQLDSGYNIISE